jgi:long-chain acyl-CoA synthetase
MKLGPVAIAQENPDRVALVFGDRTVPFAELSKRVRQLACSLREAGLNSGDAVAVLAPNCVEFVEAMFATELGGFRLTPINPSLSKREVEFILNDCDAKALLTHVTCAPTAAAIVDSLRPPGILWSIGGRTAGYDSYDDIVMNQSSEEITVTSVGGVMLYTSGTTGRPKGVVRRSPSLSGLRELPLILSAAQFNPGKDTVLCTGSLCHGANFNTATKYPLMFGVGVVLMAQFDPENALRLIEKHRITHTHMVTQMFQRLLALPQEIRQRYDLSSLRFVLHGAAPCPSHVKAAMIDWLGPVIYEYYGSVEAFGAFMTPGEYAKKTGSVGRADSHYINIRDEHDVSVSPGVVGQVFIRMTDSTRFAYHKDLEKTNTVQRGDFVAMGDLGYLDTDGYLYLVDRTADMINSGGVNVYPAEVDKTLLEHPAVEDAMAFGISNPEWGETVWAVVRPKGNITPGPELERQLIEHCKAAIAQYKCPRRIEFVDQLPRDENGKSRRHIVREQYRSALQRDELVK